MRAAEMIEIIMNNDCWRNNERLCVRCSSHLSGSFWPVWNIVTSSGVRANRTEQVNTSHCCLNISFDLKRQNYDPESVKECVRAEALRLLPVKGAPGHALLFYTIIQVQGD